jgi:hypothetical protein
MTKTLHQDDSSVRSGWHPASYDPAAIQQPLRAHVCIVDVQSLRKQRQQALAVAGAASR